MKASQKLGSYFLVGSLVLSACGRPTPGENDVIRIGHLPITHAAPLYFTKEYEEELLNGAEIELVRFSSWIELMDALNAGRIDGASVLFELAMKAKERGIGISAVALGHREGNAIVASHDVDEVADLKGETVAIPHTLSAHNLLLDEMLQREGMAYEDVNVVEMPPPEMPAALSEGRISSYIVAEPFGALGVTLEAGHVLYQSNEFCPDSCLCCALVLRDDFMEEAPELADQFVEAYLEAGVRADQQTEESLAAHSNYLNVTDEALELSLGWITYEDLSIGEEEYEHLRQRLIEMQLSDQPPTYEEFIDQSYFEEER
ncbi:metal ABC transporter substrate-binding protein [Salipaludibacillus keqinensis]|uniref:Metal ABC transporter substrate-binding protein n=1 Tax=Salipaludibacillus keqinensis TaxID=2045207 RepID=A0A323T937_9BACI|nr:ABC transporter substrate-binding protein [Salipaludibacillus keqinensis]PYZ91969.1 metal ABC transporter substrate-binding protein [Salipaludibacillus keqinensis]